MILTPVPTSTVKFIAPTLIETVSKEINTKEKFKIQAIETNNLNINFTCYANHKKLPYFFNLTSMMNSKIILGSYEPLEVNISLGYNDYLNKNSNFYYKIILKTDQTKNFYWTKVDTIKQKTGLMSANLILKNLVFNTDYILQVGYGSDKLDLKNPKIAYRSFEIFFSKVLDGLTPTPTPTSSLIIPTPTATVSPRPTATLKPALIIPTPTPTPIKKSIDYNPQIISSCLLSTKKESISPFIDTQRLSYTLIHNTINKLSTLNEINSELLTKNGLAKCKYIIKPVKLNSDSPASRLFISFAANVPNLTNIRLYYRVYNTIEDPNYTILDQVWKFIGESGTRHTFSKTEFIDFEYEVDDIVYSGNTTLKEFDMFSIKIVLESEKDSIVPKIKDFRTIALS